MDKLTGKTVLITGALWGIGEGIARTFVCHDASLTLLGISPEIEKLADELCGRGHCYAAVVTGIRDPVSVATATERAKRKEGRIGILANGAGVCRLGSFLGVSDDDRDLHIDINIKGVWDVIEAMLPEMITRKDGHTVIMSSVTGDMVTDPGETTYALTKAAIVGPAKSLMVEYAQSGIRVSAICLGYVRIPMAEGIARQSDPENPESVLTEMAKTVPMRRLADPLKVGELVASLASDESNYSTDAQNVVDGGSILPETVSVGIRFTPASSLHLWGGFRPELSSPGYFICHFGPE